MTSPRKPAGPPVADFPWNADCDQILTAAEALSPDDRSFRAEHLREVAQSVRDHRDANPKGE